jgi:glutathione S-transferase
MIRDKRRENGMILIGQYDSPFVRRVAVALRLYNMAYEHRPWSTFADADQIATFNPLRRVPTLVLDDGEVLIESGTILDWLDEQMGPRALIPREGMARRQALKLCALATGLGDKAVSLVYERVLHAQASAVWQARCETQIAGVLDALEADRSGRHTAYWFGESIGHADIAVACVLRFLLEAHPGVFDARRWPALVAHAAQCEGLPEFQAVVQVFIPPQ